MDAAEQTTALIREIRTAFNKLKSVAELLHADLGLSPSMRAVLQPLVGQGPQTVPALAKAKAVSRQHVQKIMNQLLDVGLVRSEDNPDHKRSCLYFSTPQGDRLFAEIQTREAAPIAEITQSLPAAQVVQATQLLTQLNLTLETLLNERDEHDS